VIKKAYLFGMLVIFAFQSCAQKTESTKNNNCIGPPATEKMMEKTTISTQFNVLGDTLQSCCTNPMTGWFRNGSCETAADDSGLHVVCAEMTAEFLAFSKSRGNDLTRTSAYFQGLKPGDKWCLCALRWQEAIEAGVAPPIFLASTHVKMLEFVPLETLKRHAKSN
jgi:uncharacterized protein